MTRFGRSGARRPIARTSAPPGAVVLPGLAVLLGVVVLPGLAWPPLPFHLAAQAQAVPTPSDSETPGPSRGWREVALGTGVLGGAFLLDEHVRNLALDRQGEMGRDLADLGHAYGDWEQTAPIFAGGGILLGIALDGERGVKQTTSAFFGVFAGSMANTALNWTLGRSRPRDGKGVLHFDPFRGNASLGSGHTAYVFAIAAAVDEVTDGGWAIPFYVVAAGTGLARIYGDRHWLSDVVVGGFIGWWVGGRATGAAGRWLGVEAPSPVCGGSGPHPGVSRPASGASRRPPLRIRPLLTGGALGIQVRF